jgi:hypothetical protein
VYPVGRYASITAVDYFGNRWRGDRVDDGEEMRIGIGDLSTASFSVPQVPVGMSGLSGIGLGQTGIFGTSLFESADISQWGIGEWAAIIVGGYVALSFASDVFSTGNKIKKTVRKRRSRAKKRRQLREDLEAA